MPQENLKHKQIIEAMCLEGVYPHPDYFDDRDTLRAIETIISRITHPAYKVTARELADHITDPYELFIAFYKKINDVNIVPRNIQMAIDKVDVSFRLGVLLRHPDSPKMITSKHHPLYGVTATYFESLGFRDIVKSLDCGRAPVGFIMYSFGYSMIPKLSELLKIMPSSYNSLLLDTITDKDAKETADELASILMITEDGRRDPVSYFEPLVKHFGLTDQKVVDALGMHFKKWDSLKEIIGLTEVSTRGVIPGIVSLDDSGYLTDKD